MRRRSLTLAALVALPLGAAAQHADGGEACPCDGYGPYPCAAVTLVALADQAGPLGLTDSQLDDITAIREQHLRLVHEISGEIASLKEAMHDLDRPFDAAEVFALFYDLGQHEAELEEEFEKAQADLLDVLDERQRRLWHDMMDQAACAPGIARGGAGPMIVLPKTLSSAPSLVVRQWPRARWGDALRSLSEDHTLLWVSISASGAHDLATVLPWERVLSLSYNSEGDRIEVATPGHVHRIAQPLALFTLGSGADVHRVVVVRFDGGVDLLDVQSSPLGDGAT